jgi:hypothetical protein
MLEKLLSALLARYGRKFECTTLTEFKSNVVPALN